MRRRPGAYPVGELTPPDLAHTVALHLLDDIEASRQGGGEVRAAGLCAAASVSLVALMVGSALSAGTPSANAVAAGKSGNRAPGEGGPSCQVAHAADFSNFSNMNMLMNEAVEKGQLNGDEAGFADALVRLAAYPAEDACEQQYKQAAIALADATVAAYVCREIVAQDPTIGGVNLLLACITPANAAAIAAGRTLRGASHAWSVGSQTACSVAPPSFATNAQAP